MDAARTDGSLPAHFNPSPSWVYNNLEIVRLMLFPPVEDRRPDPPYAA
jgi:hypothetical protein